MINDKFEYNLEQWKNLDYKDILHAINHYRTPFEPNVGEKTKKEIIDEFISTVKFPALQFGIKSFGWYVYMLFAVVDNSRIRVPSKFMRLSVNKGIIISKTEDNKAIVKFGYGGTFEVDLSQKIII